ncbi:MAG TPA: hypothetical protein VGV92_00995 [Gammaproteobacteria bacterium]|nr:hypothetical protein [Gammaproteobacteria bacterium]
MTKALIKPLVETHDDPRASVVEALDDNLSLQENQHLVQIKKEFLQTFCKDRLRYERNFLANHEINLAKVDLYEDAYGHDVIRDLALDKAAKKWWDIPVIRRVPRIRRAHKARRAKIENYFNCVAAIRTVENIVEAPYDAANETIAVNAIVDLKNRVLAQDLHNGGVSHALQSVCKDSIARVREYFELLRFP